MEEEDAGTLENVMKESIEMFSEEVSSTSSDWMTPSVLEGEGISNALVMLDCEDVSTVIVNIMGSSVLREGDRVDENGTRGVAIATVVLDSTTADVFVRSSC